MTNNNSKRRPRIPKAPRVEHARRRNVRNPQKAPPSLRDLQIRPACDEKGTKPPLTGRPDARMPSGSSGSEVNHTSGPPSDMEIDAISQSELHKFLISDVTMDMLNPVLSPDVFGSQDEVGTVTGLQESCPSLVLSDMNPFPSLDPVVGLGYVPQPGLPDLPYQFSAGPNKEKLDYAESAQQGLTHLVGQQFPQDWNVDQLDGGEPFPPLDCIFPSVEDDSMKRTANGPFTKEKCEPGAYEIMEPGSHEDQEQRTDGDDTFPFVCPFFRHNPLYHMDCIARRMARIQDVKQHLTRQHYEESFHCPKCLSKVLTGPKGEIPPKCQVCKQGNLTESYSVEGASPGARELLKQHLGRNLSRREQWYAIWKALFPKQPLPERHYRGTFMEETIGVIQHFWEQKGEEVSTQFLEANNRASLNGHDLSHLVSQLLKRIKMLPEEQIHETIQLERAPSTDSNGWVYLETPTQAMNG